MKKDEKQIRNQLEIGKVASLINDMTLGGATEEELGRSVRHLTNLISASKGELDWKQSEIDNGIELLKKKYQPHWNTDKNLNQTEEGWKNNNG